MSETFMDEYPALVPEPAPDPWAPLQAFTAARIALGRTGTSVPVRAALAFKLAHAHARDAVYSVLDTEKIEAALARLGLPCCQVCSRAANRPQYLQRPDLGRQLAAASQPALQDAAGPYDVALILADGLSATAVNDHAAPLLDLLVPQLRQAGLSLAPVALVREGRVAIGDAIGHLLQARLTLLCIGERPGLSAPNSLGVYFTYNPKPGTTDEARNCLSNIRPEGLPYAAAADKIFYLAQQALRRQLTGVALKDEQDLLAPAAPAPAGPAAALDGR